MNASDLINSFVQFREQVYGSFIKRQDSLMDLLDALSGNEGADSVVELSLNPLFRRGYSAVYAAIGALGTSKDEVPSSELPPDSLPQSRFPCEWIKAIANVVPAPEHRDYWLFGVDVTPVARRHAVTLKDRESVYQPTVITGQKPITLGHNYSLMSAIPETEIAGGRYEMSTISSGRCQLSCPIKRRGKVIDIRMTMMTAKITKKSLTSG